MLNNKDVSSVLQGKIGSKLIHGETSETLIYRGIVVSIDKYGGKYSNKSKHPSI
jgi:hypothetical protein